MPYEHDSEYLADWIGERPYLDEDDAPLPPETREERQDREEREIENGTRPYTGDWVWQSWCCRECGAYTRRPDDAPPEGCDLCGSDDISVGSLDDETLTSEEP